MGEPVIPILETPFSRETPLKQQAHSPTAQTLEESCGLQHRAHPNEVFLRRPSCWGSRLPLFYNAFYRGNLYCKGSILPSGVRHHLLSPEPWSVHWVCHPPGNRRHLTESLRLPPALLPRDQDKYAFLLKINHFTKNDNIFTVVKIYFL